MNVVPRCPVTVVAVALAIATARTSLILPHIFLITDLCNKSTWAIAKILCYLADCASPRPSEFFYIRPPIPHAPLTFFHSISFNLNTLHLCLPSTLILLLQPFPNLSLALSSFFLLFIFYFNLFSDSPPRPSRPPTIVSNHFHTVTGAYLPCASSLLAPFSFYAFPPISTSSPTFPFGTCLVCHPTIHCTFFQHKFPSTTFYFTITFLLQHTSTPPYFIHSSFLFLLFSSPIPYLILTLPYHL